MNKYDQMKQVERKKVSTVSYDMKRITADFDRIQSTNGLVKLLLLF